MTAAYGPTDKDGIIWISGGPITAPRQGSGRALPSSRRFGPSCYAHRAPARRLERRLQKLRPRMSARDAGSDRSPRPDASAGKRRGDRRPENRDADVCSRRGVGTEHIYKIYRRVQGRSHLDAWPRGAALFDAVTGARIGIRRPAARSGGPSVAPSPVHRRRRCAGAQGARRRIPEYATDATPRPDCRRPNVQDFGTRH